MTETEDYIEDLENALERSNCQRFYLWMSLIVVIVSVFMGIWFFILYP